MKKSEKISYLKTHQMRMWLMKRQKVWTELSEKQPVFCCCGKLASGIHESSCSKFQGLVDTNTLKELEHLLPKTSK